MGLGGWGAQLPPPAAPVLSANLDAAKRSFAMMAPMITQSFMLSLHGACLLLAYLLNRLFFKDVSINILLYRVFLLPATASGSRGPAPPPFPPPFTPNKITFICLARYKPTKI